MPVIPLRIPAVQGLVLGKGPEAGFFVHDLPSIGGPCGGTQDPVNGGDIGGIGQPLIRAALAVITDDPCRHELGKNLQSRTGGMLDTLPAGDIDGYDLGDDGRDPFGPSGPPCAFGQHFIKYHPSAVR